MDYEPDRDPGKDARDEREIAPTSDLEGVMDLFEDHGGEGILYSEALNPDMAALKAFPDAAHEDGNEHAVGTFLTTLINHADRQRYTHDWEQAQLSRVGTDLYPGTTLHIQTNTGEIAPYAVGRIINDATARGGTSSEGHNAFGYKADGQLINNDKVVCNMAENAYGIGVNDGEVVGSMGRPGWGAEHPNNGTFINRKLVKGQFGGGSGLHINTDTVDKLGGYYDDDTYNGVYINFGTVKDSYSELQHEGNTADLIIDPSLDEDEYSSIGETVVGRQTLDDDNVLRQYIADWEQLVTEADPGQLCDALERLDPSFDPDQRSAWSHRVFFYGTKYDEGQDEKIQEAHRESRYQQQPQNDSYVEAVVADRLADETPNTIDGRDEHRQALREVVRDGL